MPKGERSKERQKVIPFCVLYNIYHKEKRPSSDVADIVGCEKSAVLRRMKKIGFPVRHHNDTKRGKPAKHLLINLPSDEVINEYRKDYVSASGVGRKFGVSVAVINRILSENEEPKKENRLLRDRRKEKHPGWNPKKTEDDRVKSRNDYALVIWRNDVYSKDAYSCVKCGDSSGGNLNAHHISPYWKHKELRTDVNNGATLCEPCHKLFHDTYGWKYFSAYDFCEFMK